MQIIHKNILYSLVGVALLLILLLLAFQPPMTEETLVEKKSYYQRLGQEDSLLYYHNRLVVLYQKNGDKAALLDTYKDWIIYSIDEKQLSAEATKALLSRYQKIFERYLSDFDAAQSWLKAFAVRLAILENKEAEALSLLSELKALADKPSSAVYYAYTELIYAYLGQWGQYDKARDYLYQSKAYITESDSLFSLGMQAYAYQEIGRLDSALLASSKYLRQLGKEVSTDSLELANAYNNHATILMQLREMEEAEETAKQAINYLSNPSPNNYGLLATFRFNLANFYTEKAAHNKSLQQSRAVAQLLKAIPPAFKQARHFEIELLNNNLMALSFLGKSQLDSSAMYWEKAWALQKKYPIAEGQLLFSKSLYLQELGQLRQATKALRQCVEAVQKNYGNKDSRLAYYWYEYAKLLHQQKRPKEALDALEKAIWASSSSTKDSEQQLPAIASLFVKADMLDILSTRVDIAVELYNQSKYNYSLNRIYEDALYNLQLLQELRYSYQRENNKKDLLTMSNHVFEQALNACWEMYLRDNDTLYLQETFIIAEQSKSLLLQEALQEKNAAVFGGVPTSLIQEERQQALQISQLNQAYQYAILDKDTPRINLHEQQLAQLKAEKDKLVTQIEKSYPQYHQFKYQNNYQSATAVQKALPDSTALVSYFEGEKAIFQFVVTSDTFQVKKIIWRAYREMLKNYYLHFTNSDWVTNKQKGTYKNFCRTSYELYHKILHTDMVGGCKRLIVVPDGQLSYIPFETLLTKRPPSLDSFSFADLSYLVQQKSISYNYSASLWAQQRTTTQRPINNQLLGMAVTYTNAEKVPDARPATVKQLRKQLSPLKGTAKELALLEEKYDGDYYVDDYASEYYFNKYASQYGILHLAMHGIVQPNYPDLSCMALAEDGYAKEDNLLTINEIKQLDLKCGLVVLSACQTGYGKYQKGEGVISLGRSFMYAGTPAVVMTLWQLSDYSAPVIMDLFYEQLKAGKLKDEALRQAKINYLAKAKGIAAHPAFWACYVQLGNTDNIAVSEPVTHIWWFIIPIVLIGLLGWWSMQALRQRR